MGDKQNTHSEYFFLKDTTHDESKEVDLSKINWFKEMITFDTLREAEHWVYNGDAYNKIGTEFDGYMTGDPKLAFSLVFHLVRENRENQRFSNIFADEQLIDGKTLFMVWVEQFLFEKGGSLDDLLKK